MDTVAASFDPRQLRDVLGTFVTGVTVVTTRDKSGTAHGVTANSFSSVSLDPPLVLWSQSLTSKSYPAFRDSDHFAVNILADDQVAISNHFAKSREDKFSGIAHTVGIGDVPVLDGAAGHLECVKVAAYPSGDHVIYIGRVERIGSSSRRGLAYSSGKYVVPYSHDLGTMPHRLGNMEAARLESIRSVIGQMRDIASEVGEHTLCLGVWGNHGPTAIHWEPSAQPVSDQLRTGLVMSMTRSATGRAFSAFIPPETSRPFIEEDIRSFPTDHETVSARLANLERELGDIRERGMARSIGSTPSLLHQIAVNAFSVPIRNANGDMVMALSLTSPATRLSPEWDGKTPQALVRAAQRLSERIR